MTGQILHKGAALALSFKRLVIFGKRYNSVFLFGFFFLVLAKAWRWESMTWIFKEQEVVPFDKKYKVNFKSIGRKGAKMSWVRMASSCHALD